MNFEPQKRALTPQVLPDGSASRAAGNALAFAVQLGAKKWPLNVRPGM